STTNANVSDHSVTKRYGRNLLRAAASFARTMSRHSSGTDRRMSHVLATRSLTMTRLVAIAAPTGHNTIIRNIRPGSANGINEITNSMGDRDGGPLGWAHHTTPINRVNTKNRVETIAALRFRIALPRPVMARGLNRCWAWYTGWF